MLCNARIKIEIEDAEIIAKALSVDDPGWCRCTAERSTLEIAIDTEKIGAMMYAVDDYLMHVKMCESLLSIKNLITKR